MDPNGEETFKFESSVVGGAIPKEYIPAVGEGIEEAAKAGILGGLGTGVQRRGRWFPTMRSTLLRWLSISQVPWHSRMPCVLQPGTA